MALSIMRPMRSAAINVSSGSGAANLATPSPKEVWVAGASGSPSMSVDLGANQLVDTVYLGATNLPPGSAMYATVAKLADFSDAAYLGSTIVGPVEIEGAPSKAYLRGVTPRFGRYLNISTVIGSSLVMQAGNLLVGRAVVPLLGQEWGMGRGIVDTGTRERLIDGGFGTAEGARKGSVAWTFADLSDAEVRAIYALGHRAGEMLPIVVSEDDALGNAPLVTTTNVALSNPLSYVGQTASGGHATAWNAFAVTAARRVGGVVTFQPFQTNKALMVGLAATASGAIADFACAAFLDTGGGLRAYVNGVDLGSLATYAAGENIAVVHRNAQIDILKGNAIIFSMPAPGDASYYAAAAFQAASTAITNFNYLPGGQQEALHYGLFDRFEKYERRAEGASRWGLAMEEWV